ncbi:hypothetical protein [Escherichia coli]|uniref:hypothetical protein n=1 Tax=Escherichia coli TaxID=562 RepID=UPI00388F4F81
MSQLQLQKNTPVASVKDVTPEVVSVRIWPSPYKDRAELKQLQALNGTKKKHGTPKPGLICTKTGEVKPENVVIEQSPAMTLQEEVETALKDIGASSCPIPTGARSIQLWMVRSIGSQ